MRSVDELKRIPRAIFDAVSPAVIGKEDMKREILAALLSGGHVLLEGPPGTGKTLLGKRFAEAIGGEFRRVQLTPDLLPADVTGFFLYTPDGASRFIRGPIFANVVLADELNRTPARTQAAFLEAMQEGQVTIEGQRHQLPRPFMVIATQQMSGAEGTFPLPDVQADRFMVRSWSSAPTRAEESEILERVDELETTALSPVTNPDEIMAVRELVTSVEVLPELRSYIVELVQRVREDDAVVGGPSVRASTALYRGARVMAFLDNREYVIPDDIKQLCAGTLVHRIRLREEAEMDGVTAGSVVEAVLQRVEPPRFART